MGAYLSSPVTETTSKDEQCHSMRYGASSMQGWRMTQEDAHSAIIDYDDDTQFFAVFDGHGGAEVAQYSAQNLHKFIKSRPDYKAGNLAKCLEESFIEFDASLIKPEVMEELKVLAGTNDLSEDDEEEEDEANMLLEEATMPIEDVLATRYVGSESDLQDAPADSSDSPSVGESSSSSSSGSSKTVPMKTIINSFSNSLRKELLKKENKKSLFSSPYLRAKKKTSSIDKPEGESSKISSSQEAGCTSSSSNASESHAKPTPDESVKACSSLSNGDIIDSKNDCPVAASSLDSKSNELPTSSHKEEIKDVQETCSDSSSVKSENKDKVEDKNATEIQKSSDSQVDSSVNSTGEEAKPYTGKGKQRKIIIPEPVKPKLDENEEPIYEEFLKEEYKSVNEDDGSDDDEEDFEADASSSDDDDDDDEEEDEEDDEEDEEEDEEDEEGNSGLTRIFGDKEEPGKDSGCTAVVALVRGNWLYVANAGDSRCVLCRNGKAIDMSLDHKPEDEIERTRIETAGGKVTADGRVNGGLNLSRAIGDHAYKENANLSLKDQMISSLPDIKTIQLEAGNDEFMVLACDGIWNSLSSQQVVDFVKEKLKVTQKLSTICEDLFKRCLSPDTCGDGTGCDNMTCIIIKFENIGGKRKASCLDGEVVEQKETTNGKKESSELTDGNIPESKKVKSSGDEAVSDINMINCSATTV